MSKVSDPKTKYCFVLMPIADVAGYEAGHFGRVYEHLFKPAITAAGYTPIRADDTVKTDYIVVGIIQKIVDSSMVLCDFSSRNANVMYELGIRHAFNKPVVLVKDQSTEKIFDIQGLRYHEYDQSLRVDSVSKDIQKISQAIQQTASGGVDSMNSIVQLAGIKAAEAPKGQVISADTKLLLEAIDSFNSRFRQIEERLDFSASKIMLETLDLGRLRRGIAQKWNEKFILPTGETVERGETVFRNGYAIGVLQDFNEKEKRIVIKPPDGAAYSIDLDSVDAKTISTIPF